MPRRPLPPLLALLALLLAAGPLALALETGRYLFDPGGRVQALRLLDVDRDGRPDLVALVQRPESSAQDLLVLRTPKEPHKRHFYPPDHVVRIACDGDLAAAGAVAVGRFGAAGEARLRFLTPAGIVELTPEGLHLPSEPRRAEGTLLGRSPGRALVFWDGVGDLDGDGCDELWFPLAVGDGPLRVLGGRPEGDRVLGVTAANEGSSGDLNLLARSARVPNLFAADLDGDGSRELVALQGTELVAWSKAASGAPDYRLPLPFLVPDPGLGPEEQRVARIQLADVDGDKRCDLLVTLITGQRSKLESLRTILFHYPGPFRDPTTGALTLPRARIDTQSVVLHPTFVDLDGDGDLDYVGDSIRGSRLDLIARILGKDPTIHHVGFRFDAARGTFEDVPYFTSGRVYPSAEALSNSFGRNARMDGDFDGDGHKDLLDLGDLTGVGVVRGAPRPAGQRGDGLEFAGDLVARIPVEEGLRADSVVADLNADGRADAVLWSSKSLFLIVSRGAR